MSYYNLTVKADNRVVTSSHLRVRLQLVCYGNKLWIKKCDMSSQNDAK